MHRAKTKSKREREREGERCQFFCCILKLNLMSRIVNRQRWKNGTPQHLVTKRDLQHWTGLQTPDQTSVEGEQIFDLYDMWSSMKIHLIYIINGCGLLKLITKSPKGKV